MANNKQKPAQAKKSDDVLFRIPLSVQMHKVDLPPLDVWSRLQSTADNLEARLPLRTRIRGFFCDTKTSIIWRKCILSPKGYLVVYMKEEDLRGYALDLMMAKSIRVEALTTKYASKKGYIGTEKEYVTATIKWTDGSVCLFLSPEFAYSWITMMLAFKKPTRLGTPMPAPTPMPTPINSCPRREIPPTNSTANDPGNFPFADDEDSTVDADFWTSPDRLDWNKTESVTTRYDPLNLDSSQDYSQGLIIIPSVTILSVGPEQINQLRKFLAAVDNSEDAERQQ